MKYSLNPLVLCEWQHIKIFDRPNTIIYRSFTELVLLEVDGFGSTIN